MFFRALRLYHGWLSDDVLGTRHMRGLLKATVCLAALLVATIPLSASAATELVSFAINSNSWNHSATIPYGLSADPSFSGNLSVDPATHQITQLNYVTGGRSWTAGDLEAAHSGFYDATVGSPANLQLAFSQGSLNGGNTLTNYVSTNSNGADISSALGTFIGCSNCVTITSVEGGLTAAPSSPLVASVISGFGNLIQLEQNSPDATQEQAALANCVTDPQCNFTPLQNQITAHEQAAYNAATAAATSSEGLILETGPDSIDPGPLIVYLANHMGALVGNAVSLYDFLTGKQQTTSGQVSLQSISGNGYAIDTDGFFGNYYDITATVQLPDAELNQLALGNSFSTNVDLGDGQTVYGDGVITSLVDPPGFGTAQIEFRGFEQLSGAAPEPSTWAMLLAGFGALGATIRRSRGRSSCAKASA